MRAPLCGAAAEALGIFVRSADAETQPCKCLPKAPVAAQLLLIMMIGACTRVTPLPDIHPIPFTQAPQKAFPGLSACMGQDRGAVAGAAAEYHPRQAAAAYSRPRHALRQARAHPSTCQLATL